MNKLQQFNQKEEKRFDEDYIVMEIGNFSEQLTPNGGEKRPIKDWIVSHDARRDDSIREMIEAEKIRPTDLVWTRGEPQEITYHEGYNKGIDDILKLFK